MWLAWLAVLADAATRDALRQLYEVAHGAVWHRRTNWLSDRGVCKWHGIECAGARGEVTSVDLGGNGVVGTLPAALASLTSLRVLNIDESRLSGTLPAGLSSLTTLTTILLATNPALAGTLPSLGGLGGLMELDISRSRVSGTLVAASLGGLRSLQRLQLDRSRLTGTLPTQLGALPHIGSLFVHEIEGLSGVLPTQLGALGPTLLHGASFASTRLSGSLPTELGHLTRLRQLWLHRAALSGTLPRALGAMRALNQLEVHANRLSGALPSELGALALRACVLTAAQGPHQPRHGLRAEDAPAPDTNAFACPLPRALPAPCVPHLRCTEVAVAARLEDRPARGARRQRGRGRGGRRGARRLLRRVRTDVTHRHESTS
jgi:hypothetical protein